jgi:hypothetical protein
MKVTLKTQDNKTKIIFPNKIMFNNADIFIKTGNNVFKLNDELVEIENENEITCYDECQE